MAKNNHNSSKKSDAGEKRETLWGLIDRLLGPILELFGRGIRNWCEKHPKLGPLLAVVLLTCVGLVSWWFISGGRPGLPLQSKPLSIALLYPRPDSKGSAINRDAAIQQDGFEAAVADYKKGPSRTYRLTTRNIIFDQKLGDNLLREMKTLYYDDEIQARVFIVTFSSAAYAVKNKFAVWRDSIESTAEKPILVVTVASAPGIADAKKGIFRLYVRCEEETAELAKYARWKKNIDSMYIFYITKNVGKDDDAYGTASRDSFIEAFRRLGGNVPSTGAIGIASDGSNAKAEVAHLMHSLATEVPNENQKRLGVFVVGYATMFKEVLNELIAQGFQGDLLCGSTLTEPDWQPVNKTYDNRIVTVIPERSNMGVLSVDQNVVYLLSKITLSRVLHFAESGSTHAFVEEWHRDENSAVKHDVQIHFLGNGDAIIPMQISSTWRNRSLP